MTLPHDLVWQNLDLVNKASIAHQFACYALGLSYEALPQDVVHQAKRSLLDALGCAIGAYDAPGRPVCEAVIQELGGKEEATLFGSGRRSTALNATLLNSFLVRFLDYNDEGGGGHNSDSIPAILAVAECEKASGRDFLTSLVIAYELGARVIESVDMEGKGLSLQKRGFSMDIRGGLSMPAALGRLMMLTEEQIANAIGTCACGSILLNIVDCDREEFGMVKNLRFGKVAYDAVLACRLAKKGFTGPVRVVEGESGICQVILQGNMNFDRLTDFSGWRMLNTRHKNLCACGAMHAHLYATLDIVRTHDLKPEDIAAVRIKFAPRIVHHMAALAKKYPRNAETADHSAFYAHAFAIKERNFGPDSSKPENFTDPVILDLIEKISAESDPSLEAYRRGGKAEIITKDGRKFEKTILTPHGYGDDPLTDAELGAKFGEMAIRRMSEKQIKQIIDTVWNVESLNNMGRLMKLMTFQS
jgi:2-methylcitrate dehydratase